MEENPVNPKPREAFIGAAVSNSIGRLIVGISDTGGD